MDERFMDFLINSPKDYLRFKELPLKWKKKIELFETRMFNKDKSNVTRKSYLSYVIDFLKYCNDNKIDFNEINDDIVGKYVIYRENKYAKKQKEYFSKFSTDKDIERKINPFSKASKFKLRISLRMFFKTIKDFRKYEEIESIKVKKHEAVVIPDNKLNDLINAAGLISKDERLRKRNKLILMFFLTTGCRVGEVSKIRLRNVVFDSENPSVLVVGKGGKERTVFLDNDWCNLYLNHIKSYYPDREYLFVNNSGKRLSIRSYQYIVNKASAKAGLMSPKGKFYSPHKFRSTYITKMIEEGVDVLTVGKSVGHESPVTTKIYVDSSKLDVKNMPKPFKKVIK